jgi:hypothetical protein
MQAAGFRSGNPRDLPYKAGGLNDGAYVRFAPQAAIPAFALIAPLANAAQYCCATDECTLSL